MQEIKHLILQYRTLKSTVLQYNSWPQGLASSERSRRVTPWRRERRVGDGRAEGSSAIGDGGQAVISLMPDIDVTGSDSLLGSILSI